MVENLYDNDKIKYTTTVEVDGKEYFQSLAHQLADFVCKKNYDDFRLSANYGFTSAELFIEDVLETGNTFKTTKYGLKKSIGVLLYDVDKNQIILKITNDDRINHEFCTKGELDNCFAIQYDVFKYLRDEDLISIFIAETMQGSVMTFCYSILKINAIKNGRRICFKGRGTQYYIPIADFWKSETKKFEVKKIALRKSKIKENK